MQKYTEHKVTASYQGCECDLGAVLLLLIFKILLMCVCMMCLHGHSTHGGQRNSCGVPSLILLHVRSRNQPQVANFH